MTGARVNKEGLIAYFGGRQVPLAEARVSVLSHAFLYGTAVFEGIRGYRSEDGGQKPWLLILKFQTFSLKNLEETVCRYQRQQDRLPIIKDRKSVVRERV